MSTIRTGKITLILVLSILLGISFAVAGTGRWEREVTGEGWKLWLDRDADWMNDDVYLPPVDISKLPVNPPSCGWDKFKDKVNKIVTTPGTVEEHYWGANGNPVGWAGDYRGVSWWSTTFTLDAALKGKRIILHFDCVNLRAEVFVNQVFVGYDVIGNTPFEVDITKAVQFDGENTLNVRITDPVGNFDWCDNLVYRWGKNKVPGVHGFGGVTGKVFIRATDAVHIDDVYMQNKPTPTEVEAFITLGNSSKTEKSGTLAVVIHEWKDTSKVVFNKSLPVTIPREGKEVSVYAKVPKAKLWNVKDPHLYVTNITFTGDDGGIVDSMDKRFGFRYFTVGEKKGDKRFYLNGKRVYIFASMTRCFWPKNGIYPTSEMIERDIDTCMKLGYNMMLFHRAIGNHYVMERCDEVGLLAYGEPGGYRIIPAHKDKTCQEWRREKLKRMVIRDRSYPSMIIYNLKNEAREAPDDDDLNNMKMVHTLDPTRILTYNSDRNREIGEKERLQKDPYKLHMLPYDDTMYYHGWWDHHHWIYAASYQDDFYNNPRFYLRGVVDGATTHVPSDSLYRLEPDEIIFWGEEGSYGTMLRLGKIKEELDKTGATGWRELEHLDWYKSYNQFLDESGFRKFFPTVDDMILSMGRNLHYYHGRSLENTRMGNISDGFNLNGWASGGTHSDIVDAYRNPTADTSILSYYAQPLYVAVKLRTKVCPAGYSPIADFFIINEVNLRGPHTLEINLVAPDGTTVFSQKNKVSVTGGEEFGELLVEGVTLPPLDKAGYYKLNASLVSKKGVEATGFDDIFVTDYMSGPGIHGVGAVIDNTGIVNEFLKKARGITLPTFDPDGPDLDFIIVGGHDFNVVGRPRVPHISGPDDVIDRVRNGATLIILQDADKWAQSLDEIYSPQCVQYLNSWHWGNEGRFIVGKSPYLDGLPQAQAMNWEYQVFYRGDVWGMNLGRLGVETIVALGAQNRRDIINALCRVPHTNGQIFFSTLDIMSNLASERPQSAVAKKLFLNLIELSGNKKVK